MPSERNASIRYVEKKIAELENSVKANRARNNVGNKNSMNNAFVFDTNNGNFARNVATLSLIPGHKRIDVGARHGNTTWIPYDVRTMRQLLNSGIHTIPHLSGQNIPPNVRNLVNIMEPRSSTAAVSRSRSPEYVPFYNVVESQNFQNQRPPRSPEYDPNAPPSQRSLNGPYVIGSQNQRRFSTPPNSPPYSPGY